jgi:hypothetical protein
MNFSGWIFMISSWTVILGMFGYCMYRTLKNDYNERANNKLNRYDEPDN